MLKCGAFMVSFFPKISLANHDYIREISEQEVSETDRKFITTVPNLADFTILLTWKYSL
jgi:hypothetical protein